MNIYDMFPEYYLDSRKHKERYLMIFSLNGCICSIYKNYVLKCDTAECSVVALRKSGQVVYYSYNIDNIVK